MRYRIWTSFIIGVTSFAVIGFFTSFSFCGSGNVTTTDKDLTAKMIRFGQQAFQRGRYLDAKEFYRKAIEADPHDILAWKYYDIASIYALAEKIKKNDAFFDPDHSPGSTPANSEVTAPPVPAIPDTKSKPKVKSGESEGGGCT